MTPLHLLVFALVGSVLWCVMFGVTYLLGHAIAFWLGVLL